MAEPIKASVTFDDFKGTLAMDGHQHLSFTDMPGKRPKGYVVVGVEFAGSSRDHRHPLEIDAAFFAVDESILPKPGIDGVKAYARQHGSVPVFRFETNARIEDLLPKIKRLHIVLTDGNLHGMLQRVDSDIREMEDG